MKINSEQVNYNLPIDLGSAVSTNNSKEGWSNWNVQELILSIRQFYIRVISSCLVHFLKKEDCHINIL